jgi:single-strand DNA-binding protein
MGNFFMGKGNLADSPKIKTVTGRNGEFEVANMRAYFGRYQVDSVTGEVAQVGGFWREIEIYNQKAVACARVLRKGARVLVVGEERTYTGRDEANNEVEVFKILADDVALVLTRVESVTYIPSRPRQQAQEPVAA